MLFKIHGVYTMPYFIQEVPELDYCVRRPVVSQIVDDLFMQTNIDPKQVKVYLMGDSEVLPNLNSTLDERSNKERLNNATRLEVSISEEVVNGKISAIQYPENVAIFKDNDLRVMIKPTNLLTKNTISCTFVCQSRTQAKNWAESIRRQISQRATSPIHTANYYYPVPIEYLYILSKIFEMRQRVAPYPSETFGGWLKQKFVNRMSTTTNMAGNQTQFIIREQQTNIIGHYEFDEDVEKPSKENGILSYSVNFDYTFYYERPSNLVIEYPIVVHNQIIPKEIRDDREYTDLRPTHYYLNNSGAAFHHLAFNQQQPEKHSTRNFSGESVPFFDDWYPSWCPPYYESLVRVASCISPKDLKWVGNVDDVTPYEFTDAVIDYMKYKPHTLVQHRENLFNISLHRWDRLFATSDLMVDKNLKVTSPVDLNLRDMWHLCVDINFDLSALSDQALIDLGKHPDVLEDVIDVFYPDTPLDDMVKQPDGTYDLPTIKDAIKDSDDDANFAYQGKPPIPKTVGAFSIFAKRKN